jgi:beta-1,4-N-acetylglucosaminyltransferase
MAASTQPEAVRPGERVDVLLVCSAGGHLLQLYLLRQAWEGLSHGWVTLEREDSRSLLAGERVFYGHGPTTRNAMNFLKNVWLAYRLLPRLRPRIIVTTGAAVAVPFAWIGRLSGAKVVYIESLTRTDAPSLSCRMIRPVASRVYVQWPELARALRGSRYAGSVVGATR